MDFFNLEKLLKTTAINKNRNMNILLVNPLTHSLYGAEYEDVPTISRKIALKLIEFPRPIALFLLVALTPDEHNIRIVEGKPDDIDYDVDVDLVGISFTTRYAPLAYQIADRFMERGVKVVLGGWHPSALPEEAIQHADSVVVGEAEYIWPKLLEDAKNNKLKRFYIQDKPVDVMDIPSLTSIFNDIDVPIGIQATRGCPHGCEYCAITHMIYRNIFRARPVEIVVDEIEKLPQETFIFFDNSLTISPRYTKRLFKEIVDRGINKKFTCFGNINILGRDEELLFLSNEAGCVAWLVGFESVSQESLDSVKKKTNVVKNYKSAVAKIHDYNLFIVGNFVFGFDGDGLDIFQETVDMIKTCEIDVPDIMILTPLPGTPLFRRLDAENRILTYDWSKYNFENVVFQPKNMTPEELLINSRLAFKEVYSTSNIIYRVAKAFRFSMYKTIDVAIRNFYLSKKRYQKT